MSNFVTHLKLSWENEAKPNPGPLSLIVETDTSDKVKLMIYSGGTLTTHLPLAVGEVDQLVGALVAARMAALERYWNERQRAAGRAAKDEQ